ncbi:MAG TPA: metal-dependent hydrolase [Candidatus Paceibacterota bacterium]|nr:metal-dependent hydrolase [Candidatus Paceibacterota bacterium]
MLLKTHFVISLFFVLLIILFSGFFENYPFFDKAIFVSVALISTLLPDIDSKSSKVGRNIFSRIIQFFTKHRGMLHSLNFCIFISFVLFLLVPLIAPGFLTGYSLHLIADGLTEMGILLFWPSKKLVLKGFIKTGKTFEKFLFFIFSFGIFLEIFIFFWRLFL